jgi:LPS sulfotransferase NodH
MEWKEQFERDLDFSAGVEPSVKYAICSTPRSGSHFLGQLLYGTGQMGCPLEYFNGRNIVHWQTRAAEAGAGDLFRFLLEIRTSPNGCFGLKVHFPQLRILADWMPFPEFLTDFAHVHIVRCDLLAQAISFARAQQTGEWISRTNGSGRVAVYDGGLIRRCLVEIARQNASWQHLFHVFGLRYLVVDYDSLAADPPRVVHEVAAFVGIDMPLHAKIPGPRTARQRDHESESWRERFLDEVRREPLWTDIDVLRLVSSSPGETGLRRWKQWVKRVARLVGT